MRETWFARRSRLWVQPASIPSSICGATGARPTALACTVSFVLPRFFAKATVVSDSRRGSPCLSRATAVKTSRSGSTITQKTPVIGYSTRSGPRMTMRKEPPGRTSISQIGLVNPFGPHHFAICFGSIHALNTTSRGASRRRVMTSSRLSPTVELVAVIIDGSFLSDAWVFWFGNVAGRQGRSRSYCIGLHFGQSFAGERALFRNGPDFHHGAIRQTRTFFGDGHCLVEALHLQQEVTANGFLGFRKRAIGHHSPILSGNDFTLPFQRISGHGLALLGQPVEPGHPLARDLLHLFRREAFVPVGAAEYQHVFGRFRWCAHNCLSLSG